MHLAKYVYVRVRKLVKKKHNVNRRSEKKSEYKNQPSDINYYSYKVVRNQVNKLVRIYQDSYWKKLIQNFKGNEKRCYGFVQNL